MEKVKSYFSNLWFYHKWHILVGALILLMVGIATYQCATKETPDVNILYIGDMDPGNRDEINEQISAYYNDIDGDGKKMLSLAFMGITDEQTLSRLQTEVVAGDHVIYIIDPDYYQKLLRYDVLAPLQEILGKTPEGALDKYGVPIKHLDMSTLKGFDRMPLNSVLCIRGTNGDKVNYQASSENYKNNVKLFTSLVNYKAEGLRHVEIKFDKMTLNTLSQTCINSIEESTFYVTQQKDKTLLPYISFEEYGLHAADGKAVFGDNEKAAAEKRAVGNKILILDSAAYKYLSEKGALKDISDIYKGKGGEQFGVLLNGTDNEGKKLLQISELLGFGFIDTGKTPSVYICATADIEGDTADVFSYLLSFKY